MKKQLDLFLLSIPLNLTLISPEKWIPGKGRISGWISGYVSYAMRDGRPLLKALGVVGTVEVDDGVPHGSKI